MTIQQASEQIQNIKNQLATAGAYETAVLEARLYDARMYHLRLLKEASAARAKANARARADAMRSIGMTKTRYGWE